jgi:signal transduction histidine kinase
MVEAMNGKVWCESEFGQGATFIIEFPSSLEATTTTMQI